MCTLADCIKLVEGGLYEIFNFDLILYDAIKLSNISNGDYNLILELII